MITKRVMYSLNNGNDFNDDDELEGSIDEGGTRANRSLSLKDKNVSKNHIIEEHNLRYYDYGLFN